MHWLWIRHAILTLMLVFGTAAASQSLVGLTASSSQDGTSAGDVPLADAITHAAQQGVSVIVVDPDGQVISVSGTVPDEEPEEQSPMGQGSVLMKAQENASNFRETLEERLAALPSSVNEVSFILRATSPDGRIMTYVETLGFSIILFIVGRILTVEIYGKRIVRRFVVARILEAPRGYREKMPFLVFRFVMGVIGTLVSMFFAYVIGSIIFGSVDDVSVQFTIAAIYTAYFFWSVLSDVWRMILSPYLSQYRIPNLSDRDAKRLYLWAISLALLDFLVIGMSTWLADFGLNYNLYAIVYGVLALGTTLLNILMVLVNRRAITNAIVNGRRAEDLAWVTRAISAAWAPLVIVYFIFGWFALATDLVLERPVSIPLIVGTYMVFLSIIVVYGLINFVIERYFENSRARADQVLATATDGVSDDLDDMPTVISPRLTTFEDLARRVSGILAFVAGTYAMLSIWDTGGVVLNEGMIDRGLDVVAILFIGYIVYNAFRIWIDSKIAEENDDMPEAELGDEGGGASSASRLATLLPLFRNVILIIVVVSIGLIVLLELGINVSPLFAGAGVVGIAIGFGAQTLVRDIFSGAFFLIDDAFRKGEYIDIGQVKGTVEKISVRSFQLRHHLGALHTIPFGEIQVLTNYSRDWVMMKLPLRVTYDTNVDKVRKLIKTLGVVLMDDPVVGPSFLQPLKSQGVIEMQDSAMIIRVKFMTKPGDQWIVRKRVYQEIRDLFEQEGIKFAHREVTVRIADEPEEGLSQRQKEAISGAVNAAIDEDMLDDMGPDGDDR